MDQEVIIEYNLATIGAASAASGRRYQCVQRDNDNQSHPVALWTTRPADRHHGNQDYGWSGYRTSRFWKGGD